MADRQTTGGYPKIATVISADLPALGRLSIGAKIAFEPVTIEIAQAMRRKLYAEIARLRERLVPIGHGALDSSDPAPMLRSCNLISGVIDARSWAM